MNEQNATPVHGLSQRPRWVRWAVATGAVAVVAAGIWVALATGLFHGGSGGEAAPKAQPAGAGTHTQATNSDEAPTTPAASQLDIASTLYMPYSPVWDPPDEGENFWQVVDDDNGYPEFGGTTYLLAHACYDGQCVGDDARALVPGDSLTFRGARYLVDEKLEIDKAAIGDQNIWEHRDGQLVVITCIIDPSTGAIAENAILVASLQN